MAITHPLPPPQSSPLLSPSTRPILFLLPPPTSPSLTHALITHFTTSGFQVNSLSPTISHRQTLRQHGCTQVSAFSPLDENAAQLLDCCLQNVSFIVHCDMQLVYGHVHDAQQILHRNLHVTRLVLTAAKKARVSKLVLLSSEAAVFTGSPLRMIDETYHPSKLHHTNHNPHLGACGETLQVVEALVVDANSKLFNTCIVRVRMLWGGQDCQWTATLVRNAQQNRLKLIDAGQYLTSMCHVENASEGVLCALKRGKGRSVYYITDGPPVKFSDFVKGLLGAMGVPDETVLGNVPFWMAWGVANVSECVGRALGKRMRLCREGVGLVGQEITMSDQKARHQLGYTGKKTVASGLIEMRLRRMRRDAKMDINNPKFPGE